MTIAQAERFYEQDTKDYEIEKNKDFLNWLKASIKDGYHCFMETEELQELINNIVNWYEIKYPEREFWRYYHERTDDGHPWQLFAADFNFCNLLLYAHPSAEKARQGDPADALWQPQQRTAARGAHRRERKPRRHGVRQPYEGGIFLSQ